MENGALTCVLRNDRDYFLLNYSYSFLTSIYEPSRCQVLCQLQRHKDEEHPLSILKNPQWYQEHTA